MCETEIKSPFIVGEKVELRTETTTVKYRGEDITVQRQYYHCTESGHDFTDAELDDNFMWAVFRQYCNKKGFERFTDIFPKYKKKIEGYVEDSGLDYLEVYPEPQDLDKPFGDFPIAKIKKDIIRRKKGKKPIKVEILIDVED